MPWVKAQLMHLEHQLYGADRPKGQQSITDRVCVEIAVSFHGRLLQSDAPAMKPGPAVLAIQL
ncbi:MAG: hypothetical protein HC860_18725 [Alkalinema sp. RU_4_3]|nr:hypothetical protein [Alkalinema sp. RU_4_3]